MSTDHSITETLHRGHLVYLSHCGVVKKW